VKDGQTLRVGLAHRRMAPLGAAGARVCLAGIRSPGPTRDPCGGRVWVEPARLGEGARCRGGGPGRAAVAAVAATPLARQHSQKLRNFRLLISAGTRPVAADA
jgi:hypothetical protein